MVLHWCFATTWRAWDVCLWQRVERARVGAPSPSGFKAKAFSIICISGRWTQVGPGPNNCFAHAMLRWLPKWIILLPLVRTLKIVRRWGDKKEKQRIEKQGAARLGGALRWRRRVEELVAGLPDSAPWKRQGSATERQTERVVGTSRWQGEGRCLPGPLLSLSPWSPDS